MNKRMLSVAALMVGSIIIAVVNWHRGTEFVSIVLIWYVFGVLTGRMISK